MAEIYRTTIITAKDDKSNDISGDLLQKNPNNNEETTPLVVPTALDSINIDQQQADHILSTRTNNIQSADSDDSSSPILMTKEQQSQQLEKEFRKQCLWLAVYALCLSFKPSEPFLTPYLVDDLGFSPNEVNNKIYPIWTYAYLVWLIILGPLAEMTRYKPVLIMGILAQIYTRFMLIFGRTLFELQTTQVSFGMVTAVETTMLAYVYCVTVPSKYQRMSAILKAIYLSGHVSSSLIGQLLVSQFHVRIIVLMWISTVFALIALPVSIFGLSRSRTNTLSWKGLKEVVYCFSSMHFVSYCIFYTLVYAIEQLVLNYCSVLWAEVDRTRAYNGLVDSLGRLSATFANFVLTAKCFAPAATTKKGLSRSNIRVWLEYVLLVVIPLPIAALLLISAKATSLIVVYVTYVLLYSGLDFGVSFSGARIAFTSAHAAKFALVFSIATLLALMVQSIIQAVVQALGLGIRDTFAAFSYTLFGFSGVYIIVLVVLLTIVNECISPRLKSAMQRRIRNKQQQQQQQHQVDVEEEQEQRG